MDSNCGGFEYVASFINDTPFSDAKSVSSALQVTLWDPQGAASFAAHYNDSSIKQREGGRWEVIFERPDCESDYHNCCAGESGHDGSDKQAIAQVEAEIEEALDFSAMPLISDVRIDQRRKIA